jgi:DNA-binding transcriptional LysR family regulator
MGLGFAWYAEENIRQELESGSLRRLPLEEGSERFATLYLVYADREAAGPGARRLVDIIRQKVAESGAAELT